MPEANNLHQHDGDEVTEQRGRHDWLPPRAVLLATHPLLTCRAAVHAVALSTIAMGLTIGQQAPAFMCKAHTGDSVSLSNFAGKKVLLWFYPRASTGG